jgi:hypothetical protein
MTLAKCEYYKLSLFNDPRWKNTDPPDCLYCTHLTEEPCPYERELMEKKRILPTS